MNIKDIKDNHQKNRNKKSSLHVLYLVIFKEENLSTYFSYR